MDAQALSVLSRHSALSLAALRDGDWLKPLPLSFTPYLEPDLAQVLKYKGKTNADFTAMMLHCARMASDFALTQQPLTVLDPMCGRGTTLFCALIEGDHAIGIDTDAKSIHEADVYFERYLQYHRLKHRREERSMTMRQGAALKELDFTLAASAEAYKQGDTRTLHLIHGDTAVADQAVGVGSCHLIVGDLPYGVQHAPKEGGSLRSITAMLEAALPAYGRALKPGGALALAFNTYTLPKSRLIDLIRNAGLKPLETPPYDDFAHWVEQAVNRDMVIARR
ncbi:MAG: hypothetical protein VB087_01715 [Candidatus Limiplasma sp.]|nr:hypothetical protein [Candidatus Limiplasma sp.]